jgi:RHS repeat-associated protein
MYAREVRTIQERDVNNTPTVSYTRGTDLSGTLEGAGGIGGLLARSSGYSSGNWTTNSFYFADGNGNITYMLNSSQSMVASYRYDPFGSTISSTGSLASANVYRFSSKEIHANSGMYYYGYRFYDPNLQRWINRDPATDPGFALLLRISAGLSAEAQFTEFGELEDVNLYTILMNGPVFAVDVFGLKGFFGGKWWPWNWPPWTKHVPKPWDPPIDPKDPNTYPIAYLPKERPHKFCGIHFFFGSWTDPNYDRNHPLTTYWIRIPLDQKHPQ